MLAKRRVVEPGRVDQVNYSSIQFEGIRYLDVTGA